MESPNPWLKESFFVVVWLNFVWGFLLFLTRIERKPLEVFKIREICVSEDPEELHASMALSIMLNRTLLKSEDWMIDFSGRKIL